jgi:hypothetical protein
MYLKRLIPVVRKRYLNQFSISCRIQAAIMKKHNYSLSRDLTLKDLEKLYSDVVLKQEFYGNAYADDWQPHPFEDLADILVNTFECKTHMDIGCGKGLLVEAMRKRGVKSFGIDFSEGLINQSSSSIRKYLSVESSEKWTEKEDQNQYDLITYTEVLEHIPINILCEMFNNFCNVYNGKIFLTIPSYGIDSNFKTGIIVNDQPLQWLRDMMENIPFKNIVLEDGLPHHGHITLCSYKWWTEFFLYNRFSRSRDLEAKMAGKYIDVVKAYNWNPYILEKSPGADRLDSCIRSGLSLARGWHDYEPSFGRWTNGFASIHYHEENFQTDTIEISISVPTINYMQDFDVVVTIDRLIVDAAYRFRWIKEYTSTALINITMRGIPINLAIELKKLDNNLTVEDNETDCWRLNIISPTFCPKSYGLSDDSRQLGVAVHKVSVVD